MSRADSAFHDRMIFLVGARRSGTNWLQRIVTAHPDVVGVPGETYLFSRGFVPLGERFQHGAAGSHSLGQIFMDRSEYLDALRDFSDAVFSGLLDTIRPDARFLAERTPEHGTCLDLIADVYPEARVANIIRDGRDVVRSLVSHDWGPASVSEAALEWRENVSAAREAGPRFEHYAEVSYEEMLADPRAKVPVLYEGLGLRSDASIVDAALAEAEVSFNVDPTMPAIGRDKWRERFSADDLAVFLAVAGDVLTDLGYDAALLPVESGTPPLRSADGTAGRRAAALERARTVAGRVKRRVRGRPPGGTPRNLSLAQGVLDRFLGAVVSGRDDTIDQLLTPDAFVQVHGSGDDASARGPRGRELLRRALVEDPALRGRQVRGDVHPADPVFTVVARYRLPDGSDAERVLLASIVGDHINRVVWYRLSG